MSTIESTIHNRALLVSLSITTWTARKFDRQITTDVNRQYGASADAGRYNKHLLAGSVKGSYNRLMNVSQAIRLEHYHRTLPWTDEGWRILPSDQYMTYMGWYRGQRGKFETALTDFTSDYPLIRSQQVSGNPLFKPGDYPDVKDIEQKFSINVDFSPIMTSGDIRMNLAAEEMAEIERSVTNRVTQGMQTAMQDAWHRLHKVTENIAVKCADPDARLYKSMMENAKDLCTVLVNLNITRDPQLEQMRLDVEAQLVSRDVEDLRANPSIRADVATKANEILERMAAIGYGPRV
jgi:hypothetical protein